ncbi:hypothetical protein VTL71DRAFT_2532 [Oculimacula yallundae]|uniref:Uncharacterized protein n=1 Tax=Oculimacula yallundae TaxID=86028 RepID=A0ABR4C970_9HELO
MEQAQVGKATSVRAPTTDEIKEINEPDQTSLHITEIPSLQASKSDKSDAASAVVSPDRVSYEADVNRISMIPDHEGAHMSLRAGFNSWFWMLLLREILPIAGLITCLVFAFKSEVFHISSVSLFGVTLSTDLQLALVGLMNKIFDTIVQASLKHTASLFLTAWMALRTSTSKSAGIQLLDFELKEELVQPWTCIINFFKRRKLVGENGLGYRGYLRFAASLVVSICVLLLALSINTLGVPKRRWFPDFPDEGNVYIGKDWDSARQSLTVTTPRMEFHGMDWSNLWNHGFASVGGGTASWDVAIGLAAASTYTALTGLPRAFHNTSVGWQPVNNGVLESISGINDTVTGINTDVRRSAQTVSIQNAMLWNIFQGLRSDGTEDYYRKSYGWHGRFTITVPTLNTVCRSVLAMEAEISTGNILIRGPENLEPKQPSIELQFGAVPAANFSGAICQINFSQALFPVGTWVVDMIGISISINEYGKNMNNTALHRSSSEEDVKSAQQLAMQIRSVVGRMNSLTDIGLVHHLVLISRQLRSRLDLTEQTNDTATLLAPVVALLAQHLITIASWNMSASLSSTDTIPSFPMQWQVYGSGPRVAWQWATVAVVVALLMALILAAAVKAAWRMKPGPWLETGGMMLLANQSDAMASVKSSMGGKPGDEAKRETYFMTEQSCSHLGKWIYLLLAYRRVTCWKLNQAQYLE